MPDNAEIQPTAAVPERLAELEALLRDVLTIVSHDLRTPLSVVHTTASMLLNPKYKLSPQQVQDQHERVRRNVALMNRMITELMDMVSVRRGSLQIDRQPVDINEVLRDAVAAHETAARDKGLTLEYHPAVDALEADADRPRLLQVFQNLLGNAVKCTKAGDRVIVSSRLESGTARVDVVDGGPRIPADELPYVFNPYHPGGNKLQKSSTGLGLFIGKGIVDAHGGEVRCESGPGESRTFSVSLPLRG